ncbi:MAG: avidin/streptavidin family protein [Marinifilaceae bacterium]|jgi:hypothetical protein|nr:avidin/streptavidin family protein [Marinifilaceae bacterium]
MISKYTGKWINQYKSLLNISIENSKVRGTFQTAIGEPNFNEKFLVEGSINKDCISFIVNFDKYGSIGSWTGQITYEEDKYKMKCVWNLIKNETDNQNSLVSGSGEFILSD